MTPTEMIAIGAAAVAFGSMCAAIASAAFARRNARIAEQAKEQAKKAATLSQRIEAINHVRNALEDIIARIVETRDRLRVRPSERYLNSRSIFDTVTSIRRAKNLAEVVFSKDIRNKLDSALQHAEHLADRIDKGVADRTEERFAYDLDLNLKLRRDLQSLIDQMNAETALGG
jgi:hypothetical protein